MLVSIGRGENIVGFSDCDLIFAACRKRQNDLW